MWWKVLYRGYNLSLSCLQFFVAVTKVSVHASGARSTNCMRQATRFDNRQAMAHGRDGVFIGWKFFHVPWFRNTEGLQVSESCRWQVHLCGPCRKIQLPGKLWVQQEMHCCDSRCIQRRGSFERIDPFFLVLFVQIVGQLGEMVNLLSENQMARLILCRIGEQEQVHH